LRAAWFRTANAPAPAEQQISTTAAMTVTLRRFCACADACRRICPRRARGVTQPQLHGIEPGQHLGISGKPLPHGSGILGKDPRGGPYDHFAGTQPQFPLHTGKQRHGQRHQRDGGQQVEDIGARSDPGEQAKYQRRSAQRREHLTGRIAQGGQRHGIQPGKPLFEAREHQPGIRPRTGGNIVDDGLDVVGAAIRA